jgi:hypothetical protein
LRECFAPNLIASTAPTGWRGLAQSLADLATGETRCEAAPGLYAKRQSHTQQFHDDQFYKGACDPPDA